MATVLPVLEGYRTRLTGLLGLIPLFVKSPIYNCLFHAEDSPYSKDRMTDVFNAYRNHLFDCDLDPKTQLRYWQIVNGYQKWLCGRSPDVQQQKSFWRCYEEGVIVPGQFSFTTTL